MKSLIQNGRVINPSSGLDEVADIAIAAGKIQAIVKKGVSLPEGFHAEKTFDAKGCIVAPGLVETDMGLRLARAMTGQQGMADLRSLDAGSPFGRVCQPLDVANVVLWLCSEGAGYVTGQRIECDGGGPR